MIVDSTLREGLQARGVYLGGAERIELASRIAAAGIEELEIGWAGRGQDLRGIVDAVVAARSRPLVWSMARRISLEEAARSGSPAVTVCFPASMRHQEERFGLGFEQVLEWLRETVAQARELFDFVQVGLEDASRTGRDTLFELVCAAETAGADRVRLADTVGILSPLEVASLLKRIRETTRLPVGLHLHDDLGMATAGAVTALESGAATVDGTLLGTGERAGIAATEEVAAWAVMRRGERFDLAALRRTCAWFAQAAGMEVPRGKAVAGDGIFAAESGVHTEALGRNPSLYEPWDPARTGHERIASLGAKSGRAAVRRKLRDLGIPEPADIETLVDEIRSTGERLRRPLTDEEIPSLVEQAGL